MTRIPLLTIGLCLLALTGCASRCDIYSWSLCWDAKCIEQAPFQPKGEVCPTEQEMKDAFHEKIGKDGCVYLKSENKLFCKPHLQAVVTGVSHDVLPHDEDIHVGPAKQVWPSLPAQ